MILGRNNMVIKQQLAKLFETEKIKTRDALRMCGIFFIHIVVSSL